MKFDRASAAALGQPTHLPPHLAPAVFEAHLSVAAAVCDAVVAFVVLENGVSHALETGRGWLDERQGLFDVGLGSAEWVEPGEWRRGQPLIAGRPELDLLGAAPLRRQDGSPLGTLGVLGSAPQRLDERQAAVLGQLALAVSQSVELHDELHAAKVHADAHRAREQDLRWLIDNVPSMLAYWGPDLICRFANQAYEQWFGRHPDAVVGRHLSELLGPALFALNKPYLDAALAGHEQTFERIVPGPGGVGRHSLAAYLPHVVNGEVMGLLVQVTDVSGLKHAQASLHDRMDELRWSNEQLAKRTAALHESELRLRTIFSAVTEGLALQQHDGRIIDANPAAETILGLSRDQLLGRTSLDPEWQALREDGSAFAGDQHPAMVALHKNQVVRGQIMAVKAVAFGHRWLSVNAVPVVEPGCEKPHAVVVSFADVTRQHRLAKELSDTVRDLDDLYNHAPCGYHSIDAEGRIVRINDTALAWLGLRREDVVGKRFVTEFLSPEARTHFGPNFASFKARGQLDGVEFNLLGADGKARRVVVNATAVNDADGAFLYSRSVLHDITELSRTRKHLRVLLREQDAMLDNELVGISRVRDRQVVWCNRALASILGRSMGEMQNLPTWAIYPSEAAYRKMGAMSNPALRQGRTFRAQVELKRKDGSLVWVDMHGSALPKADHEALWLVIDITASKRAEAARLELARLEAENAQVREASRLKSQFIANMSHELRTPLTGILGVAELLQSGVVKPESPRLQHYVGQIARNGEHLLKLIDAVLDYAAIESGRLPIRPQSVSLRQVAQDVIDMFAATAMERRVTLTHGVDATLDRADADALRLKQVIASFLSNALKFTAEDGRVELRLLPELPHHFRVEVEDNGIGIASQDLPELFTAFHQVSAGHTKDYPGTGLGLALTRRIVEALGGRVGVYSVPGGGSVFHAVLPLNAADAGELRLGSAPLV